MIQHHKQTLGKFKPEEKPACLRRQGLQAGFSLIEILVVMSLMAMIAAYMLPNMGITFRATMDSSVRELATTIRAAYDEAALKGRVYRIAFDMDKSQYWVEQGPQNLTLMTDDQAEEEKRRDARRTDEERKAVKKPVFGIAKELTRDKISLPNGVSFSEIQNSASKKPFIGGIVYGHVFPHGIMEKLTIFLKDTGGRSATIDVDPVTGKSRYNSSDAKETKK